MRALGIFEQPGTFAVGCNWWASHAGTAMWRDWRPEVVEADFARLRAHGLAVVRLFPLWSDFQPIVQLRGYQAQAVEVRQRLGDEEVPLAGRSGVDPVMLDRLAWTAAAAERHGLRLVVGLVTGWMSGRFHAPEAVAHLDPISDPASIIWQVRLVRAVVARLRDAPAVAAWDLGNECNCMGRAASPAAAAAWTATIADAIRAADPARPVLSGMHSLAADGRAGNPWTIADQGEHCDVLTTHPYPFFVRHAAQDRVDDPRTTHAATAETRLYADLGGRPCCAEEIGSLGPAMGDEAAMAAFARVNLFSLWANDCRGLLWWCADDQGALAQAPYDWEAVERELGLFRADRSPRPALAAVAELAALRAALPDGLLPPPVAEAVCLLTRGQDQWAVAWSAWLLAKQAGFGLRFAWAEDGIPAAARYLLPGVAGSQALPRRRWLELIARVEAGADLLITLDGGILSPFDAVVGAAVASRRAARGAAEAVCADGTRLPIAHGPEVRLRPLGAEVIARDGDDDSAVVATRHRLGAGSVQCWAFPIETQLTAHLGACDAGAPEWWRVYAAWCDPLAAGRALACVEAPWLALTEHRLADGDRLVVGVNHGRETARARLRLAPGWRPAGALRGAAPADGVWTVAGQDAAVLRLTRG